MIRELLIVMLLAMPALADTPKMDSPDTLEIFMVDYAGVMHTMMAWQDNTTGTWTVCYVNEVTKNAEFFFSNETGNVRIT